MFLAISEAIAVQQIGLLPLGQPFQAIVQLPARFLLLHNALRLHGVRVGYGLDAPQLFLSRQNIVQRNALGSRRRPCPPSPSAAQKRQRHPAPCPSWRCEWQEPHRSGTSCRALHRTSARLSISPDCPLVSNRPCQGSDRTVPDSCCEKVICHLANKGLVVVNQAVQCALHRLSAPAHKAVHSSASWAFSCSAADCKIPSRPFAAVPVLPA